MANRVQGMNIPKKLNDVLAENRVVRLVEEDIYSVLPGVWNQHHYDRRAAVYDLVVGTRIYHRAMWGSSPLDYVNFARGAISSHSTGMFLDAGCGSLLFTARLYMENSRRIIASDQSLSMLRRARKRLINLAGAMPGHILLLQADLNDLPFAPNSFLDILCLNVLHQFENASTLVHHFKRLLTDDGHLFLTSLVYNNRFIGDRYLKALHATGEFVRPRTLVELMEILEQSLGENVTSRMKGNMAFLATTNFA